jgi:hypothetical protein
LLYKSSITSKYERVEEDFIIISTERIEIREIGHCQCLENHSFFSVAFTDCITANLNGSVIGTIKGLQNRETDQIVTNPRPSLEEREATSTVEQIDKIRHALVRPLTVYFSKILLLMCSLYTFDGGYLLNVFEEGLEVSLL